MVDWKEYATKTRNYLKSQNWLQARKEIQYGLEIYPNHQVLLTIAFDVYRALDDREKSLEYAELLVTHHPNKWKGYELAAQELIALKRFEDAQERIQAGLEKHPNQRQLLDIVINIYRALDDREKYLEYAKKLHDRNINIPVGIFSELLVYSLEKSIQKGSNRHESQVSAIDYYCNRRFILSSDQMPFNFIAIPKNACSSIKVSLLSKFTHEEPKKIRTSPHRLANIKLKADLNFQKEFICLVRNPFLRFISAFTDKIRPNANVWLSMCKRYGFDNTSCVSMDTLLDALLADAPNLIDRHFRPQHRIACSTTITPSRIFYMERINELSSFLKTHGCEFIRFSPHSTTRRAKTTSELNSKVIDKIYRLYMDDFALYGYSENPEIKDSSHSTIQNNRISNLLTSKVTGAQLSPNRREMDSLIFENPFLEKTTSLSLLVNNAIA